MTTNSSDNRCAGARLIEIALKRTTEVSLFMSSADDGFNPTQLSIPRHTSVLLVAHANGARVH
jgi:hypothetical protein